MRNATIVGSLLIHVLVFGYALRVSDKRKHRATSVAVVGEKKKAEPPKPKPKPVVAPPKPKHEAPPEPLKAAPSKAAPEATPPPVETGLTMDNSDAPGIDVGGKGPAGNKPAAPKSEHQAVKKEKVLAPKATDQEDNCTEAPSKPVPVTRPSEIEYTQDARANGIEGRLVLRVTVGADGAVADVQVVASVDAALDAAAIAAVKTWTFKPSMRCGKPMGGGVFTLARRFELGD